YGGHRHGGGHLAFGLPGATEGDLSAYQVPGLDAQSRHVDEQAGLQLVRGVRGDLLGGEGGGQQHHLTALLPAGRGERTGLGHAGRVRCLRQHQATDPVIAQLLGESVAHWRSGAGHHLPEPAGDGQYLGDCRPQALAVVMSQRHQHRGHRLSSPSRLCSIRPCSSRYSAMRWPPVPSSITISGSRGGRAWALRTRVRPARSSAPSPRSAAVRVRTGLDRAAIISFIRGSRGSLVTSVTETRPGRFIRHVSATPSTSRVAVTTRPASCTSRATVVCGQPSSAARSEGTTEPRPSSAVIPVTTTSTLPSARTAAASTRAVTP